MEGSNQSGHLCSVIKVFDAHNGDNGPDMYVLICIISDKGSDIYQC